MSGFSRCQVILHVCSYSSVETQLGFPLFRLGGGLQSGRMGMLHMEVVGGEQPSEQAWGWPEWLIF